MIPPLHVVAPDRAARRRGFLPTAFAMLEDAAGELALHLRLKEASARRIHELAAELSAAAGRHGGWCVVNERVDVALTAGAHAVQLGAGALSAAAVRRIAGPRLPAGVSVHGPDAAERAEREGANHLVVGTIFDSPSHPGRAGAGPELLEACRRRVDLPMVAIGGVTPDRVERVLESGADAVAALSAVWDAERPRAAVGRFLDALPARRGRGSRPEGGSRPRGGRRREIAPTRTGMDTSARDDEGSDAGGADREGDTVEVRVNGERREVPGGLTLAGLLERLDVDGRQVAVEHNRRVVPREERDETAVEEGDRVEIVQFVGGGR